MGPETAASKLQQSRFSESTETSMRGCSAPLSTQFRMKSWRGSWWISPDDVMLSDARRQACRRQWLCRLGCSQVISTKKFERRPRAFAFAYGEPQEHASCARQAILGRGKTSPSPNASMCWMAEVISFRILLTFPRLVVLYLALIILKIPGIQKCLTTYQTKPPKMPKSKKAVHAHINNHRTSRSQEDRMTQAREQSGGQQS